MTFRIGYTEFDVGPVSTTEVIYGDQHAFLIEINPGTLAEAIVMREQLNGYLTGANPVAIVWDDDPTWNGIYTVTNMSITPIENYLSGHGMHEASVTVLKHPDPVVEADYTLTYRTAPTNYYIAAPCGYSTTADQADMWTMDNGGFVMSGDPLSVSGPAGTEVGNIDTGADTAAALTEVQVQQAILPARFGIGQCALEAYTDGVGWWTVTGRSAPERREVRLSNGLMRVTPVTGERYLSVECWSGTAWAEAGRVYLEWESVSDGQFAKRWQVIRNNRAQVVLRAHLVRSGFRPAQVDIVVTRGVSAVGVVMSTAFENLSATARSGLAEFDGSNMATTTWLTAGIYRTAAIDGIKLTIVGDDSPTVSTTTDDLVWTAGTSRRFSICSSPATRQLDEHYTNYQVRDTVV